MYITAIALRLTRFTLISIVAAIIAFCLVSLVTGCRTGQQTTIANYGTLNYTQHLEKSPVSNSKETPFDVLRGFAQGAEVPIAAGATPTASLSSTGKSQTFDNNGTAAPTATKPTTGTDTATKGGDGKTTPGAAAPGG